MLIGGGVSIFINAFFAFCGGKRIRFGNQPSGCSRNFLPTLCIQDKSSPCALPWVKLSIGLYPTPANSKLPKSDIEKWRNCQALFWGWGPRMHASRVKSQPVGKHRLGFWNPKCSKSLPLFPTQLESGVKRAWNFAQQTTKPRHNKMCGRVAYETKHLKHRSRKASHTSHNFPGPQISELCNHKSFSLGENTGTFLLDFGT